MSLHRDNKLDSLIGKVVEVTLYDNTILKGVLGFTEEFSAKYDYKSLIIILAIAGVLEKPT